MSSIGPWFFDVQKQDQSFAAVGQISIEFTAERIDRTFQAIEYLESLNPIEGQVLFDDSMQWKLPNWQRPDGLKASLQQLITDFPLCIGDVYVRQLM